MMKKYSDVWIFSIDQRKSDDSDNILNKKSRGVTDSMNILIMTKTCSMATRIIVLTICGKKIAADKFLAWIVIPDPNPNTSPDAELKPNLNYTPKA